MRFAALLVLLAGCAHQEQHLDPAQARAAEQQREATIVHADCDAATAARTYATEIQCASDNDQLAHDGASAAAWYRLAVDQAPSRDQACAIVKKILQLSAHPSQDLAGVDPVLLSECQQQQQIAREDQAQAHADEQNCEQNCATSHAACIVRAADGWAQANCNIQQSSCVKQCRTVPDR